MDGDEVLRQRGQTHGVVVGDPLKVEALPPEVMIQVRRQFGFLQASFQTALRKRMEGIALNMASGSYAQRVQV